MRVVALDAAQSVRPARAKEPQLQGGKVEPRSRENGSRRDSNPLSSTTYWKNSEYGVDNTGVVNIAAELPTLSSPTADTTPARPPLSARTPTHKSCRRTLSA